ncbi:MAG: DUF2480 family protein, partial [Bacteroidota bacterium]
MDLVNRVAQSDIAVYDLAALWDGAPVVSFDLAPYLVRGLVLRERDFRQAMKDYDWPQHDGQHVAVFCSTDAIIPTWAYMLVASKLDGLARSAAFGSAADLVRDHFVRALEDEDWSDYAGKPVVIKGCGGTIVPTHAYLVATQKLKGVATKLMYGEPCSSVPIWRAPKTTQTGAARAAGAAKSVGPPGARPIGPPRAKPVGLPKPAGPPKRPGLPPSTPVDL